MKKVQDLCGQKFGKLIVIERAQDFIQDNGRKRTQFLCKCECGNTTIARAENLKNGNTKSCGCLVKEKCSKLGKQNKDKSIINLVGQKFNKLEVIKITNKRSKNREVIYLCRCDCGNEVEIRSSSLSSGNSKSCGRCDENEFQIKDDYIELITNRGEIIKFDKEDFELIKTRQWFVHGFYVRASVDYKQVTMHSFLLGKKEGYVIDHINGDKLDNRRCNLRYATTQENSRNTFKQKNCTSNFKGVYFVKKRNCWNAQIYLNRKQIFLGCFKNEIEAAKAYNKKAKELFGEFAKLNIIK